MNYEKLMQANPTSLEHKVYNSEGQEIEFYEQPTKGDLSPVIAVCHELKFAAETDFWDTEDFYEGSEYNPVFYENGAMVCEFDR